jgi:transcriptional regulator with XRE-family HTH domain
MVYTVSEVLIMDFSDVRVILAEKLKEFRLESGMTAKEVGDKIGRNEKTVSGWEHGRGQPDADMLFLLCKLYGIQSFDVFYPNPGTASVKNNPDETELVDIYRNLNKSGKSLLLQTARTFAGNPGMTEEEHGSSAM